MADEKLMYPTSSTAPDVAELEDRVEEETTALLTNRPWPRRTGFAELSERYGLVVVWLLIALFFAVTQPAFRHVQTFEIIIGSQATQIAVTLAVIWGLIGSEFDLSVAYVLGASGIFMTWLNAVHGVSIVLAIVVVLVLSVVFGLFNGLVSIKLRIPSIIVTLGTGTLLSGVITGVAGEEARSVASTNFVTVLSTTWLGLPVALYITLAIGIILYYVLEHTPFGRTYRFMGRSRDVARLGGVHVNRLRFIALAGTSLGAGIAGILLVGSTGTADPTVAPGYLLPAFAGAFLGSTALRPGEFNVWGTFVAVFFLVTGVTGLQLDGYTGWVEQVFNGAALVIAVTVTQILGRGRGKTSGALSSAPGG